MHTCCVDGCKQLLEVLLLLHSNNIHHAIKGVLRLDQVWSTNAPCLCDEWQRPSLAASMSMIHRSLRAPLSRDPAVADLPTEHRLSPHKSSLQLDLKSHAHTMLSQKSNGGRASSRMDRFGIVNIKGNTKTRIKLRVFFNAVAPKAAPESHLKCNAPSKRKRKATASTSPCSSSAN